MRHLTLVGSDLLTIIETGALNLAVTVGCFVSGEAVQRAFGGKQSGIRDTLRPLEEGVRKKAAAFVSEHRRAIAGAVRCGEGVWMVREAGANGFAPMREAEFRGIRAKGR